MRQNSEAIEEMDFMPSIADREHVRFDIHHVRGVRRLKIQNRIRHLIAHPLTMVVLVWLVMAVLLVLEVWK